MRLWQEQLRTSYLLRAAGFKWNGKAWTIEVNSQHSSACLQNALNKGVSVHPQARIWNMLSKGSVLALPFKARELEDGSYETTYSFVVNRGGA